MKTPASTRRNDPQLELKSISDQEQIALHIAKRVSGGDLGKVLQGITAFTSCFDAADQYVVTIRVDKVLKGEAGDDEGGQPAGTL